MFGNTSFKERYRNHKRDFRNHHYEKSTELSKYIWRLKKKGIECAVQWKVLSHVKGLTTKGFCSLRLTEKFWFIEYLENVNLLNKKSELIRKCRHKNKRNLTQVITWVQQNELIHMVFTTEGFWEAAIESWPEWDLNSRTHVHWIPFRYIVRYIYSK